MNQNPNEAYNIFRKNVLQLCSQYFPENDKGYKKRLKNSFDNYLNKKIFRV